MKLVKYILPAILLLMSSVAGYGSSIIVVRNDNEVVIGTDSKTVITSRGDMSDAQSALSCKIIRADNVFIAFAGIAGIVPHDQRAIPREFDLAEIMNKAALREGSIMDKADTLAKAVESVLLRMSEWAKKKMPVLFEKMFLGRQSLQVLIAGIENGSPTIVVMAFEPRISPSGEMEINIESRPCPGIACPGGLVYLFLGKHEAIDRYLLGDPEIWKDDPVDVVRKLLNIETTAERQTVGPPIDILRITKEGSEWIQKKEMCGDYSRPYKTSDQYWPIVSPDR